MALGTKDTTKPTTINDGVFFTRFKEGEPGMQPERIGSYITTLNPGYDASLPMFEPWPLFYAIKAANATPVEPFSISGVDTVATNVENFHPAKNDVLFLSPKTSSLYQRLNNLGLQMKDVNETVPHPLILLDGQMLPEGKDTLAMLKKYSSSGAQIFVIDVSENELTQLNKILPASLQLTQRTASSFIKLKNEPVVSGLNNVDLYFNELLKNSVMVNGLSGNFVNKGNTILTACNTNWSEWNNQPEYNKTGRVLKSEREKKQAGSALVSYTSGNTNYYVCSIDMNLLKGNADKLLYKMLSNLGATFSKLQEDMAMLSSDGYLKSALVCGGFDASNLTTEQAANKEFLSDELNINPFAGLNSNGQTWRVEKATGENGSFNFRKMNLDGNFKNAVAYLSFWVYSPRSLVNLLVEPDMPAFDMYLNANGAAKIILNGKVLLPLTSQHSNDYEVKNIPLQKGWNHFLIKSIQHGGDWNLGVKFESNNDEFMRKVKAVLIN
ncbi:hypothetical protein A9P82_12140 [Arachidicoccus ginsenosidimutans]|uniref:hypothetical protein n=1 Tax=Arachidicoccus sp. BS20 TaxID=1850526 RepID=UPI0007F0837E|nr:hypothetical protein [Arachidicoccus sp. BS20]ANI89969.1 hypothetical protein A9P82_12140 [Arachidicoccus sp. BS20]